MLIPDEPRRRQLTKRDHGLIFELFASEAELRLGEQVSDLLVCPEIEDALEVRPPSELAASARAHISKVLFYSLVWC